MINSSTPPEAALWSLIALLPLIGSGASLPLIGWTGQTMGSAYTIKIAGASLSTAQLDALKAEIEQCLREVNRQLSHFQSDSEISRFNQLPANTAFEVSPGFAFVLRHSLALNRLSDGAFDPTLGPVIRLWGFGEKAASGVVPSEEQIQEALAQTGCRHVTLSGNQLVKDLPGLSLNLSSPAKGYGVDEMARVLRGHGLTNVYVAISGDVFTAGLNADGQKWRVGISAPLPGWRPGDPVVTVLSVSDQAVSTSGDYQKYVLDARGRRLGHIFSPRTGWPVQHNLAGVSVVAESCMVSSSLATTLFVLGPEEGMRFIESWTNAAALFVVREKDGNFRSIPSTKFAAATGYKP